MLRLSHVHIRSSNFSATQQRERSLFALNVTIEVCSHGAHRTASFTISTGLDISSISEENRRRRARTHHAIISSLHPGETWKRSDYILGECENTFLPRQMMVQRTNQERARVVAILASLLRVSLRFHSLLIVASLISARSCYLLARESATRERNSHKRIAWKPVCSAVYEQTASSDSSNAN